MGMQLYVLSRGRMMSGLGSVWEVFVLARMDVVTSKIASFPLISLHLMYMLLLSDRL